MQNKNITLISFGYNYGQPKMADLVIDARNFQCAGFELRKKYTGLHKSYQQEFYRMDNFCQLYEAIKNQIQVFIAANQKMDIIIAIGCHQGRHRSVAIVEKLKMELTNFHANIVHTNINDQRSKARKQKIKNCRDSKYQIMFDDYYKN